MGQEFAIPPLLLFLSVYEVRLTIEIKTIVFDQVFVRYYSQTYIIHGTWAC